MNGDPTLRLRDQRPHTHHCSNDACDLAFSCKDSKCLNDLFKLCGKCRRVEAQPDARGAECSDAQS